MAPPAILSVFFATVVIDEILIKEAIQQEADYFWRHYEKDEDFHLPNTLNLTGFFNEKLLPDNVKNDLELQSGFNEFQNEQGKFVLYISEKQDQTLYLIYNRGEVDSLAAYYGLVPLTLVLIALYFALWLAYRFSHRAISPITWLAKQVNKLDFNAADFSAVKKDNLAL